MKASDQTVQCILQKNQFTKKRVKGRQLLSVKAMADQVEFVCKHLENPSPIWLKVVFSDEKKWNLNSNDRYVSYWCEKTRKYKPEVDLRRRPGIMVWGAICSNGTAFIARITGKINAEKYITLLEEVVFNSSTSDLPENYIFQQDNAPVHTAVKTREYFKKKNIPLLEWPPYSPDLNIIENLWGIVSRRVYEDGRDYKSTDDLWENVSEAFTSISSELITNLYNLIPKRFVSVLEQKGKRSKY